MLTLTLVLGITACTPPHEHSFATTWANDANYHWHAATCEHETEIADKAEHTMDGGNCTVCGYHEHQFSSEWSKDGSYHWHATICEHETEIADKAEHTMDGGNCTVCNYNEWEFAVANLNVGLFDENINWAYETIVAGIKETEIKSNANLIYFYSYDEEIYIEKCDGYYDGYANDGNGGWNSSLNATEADVGQTLVMMETYASLKNIYNGLNGLEAVYNAETKTYIVNNVDEFMHCTIENGRIIKIEAGEGETVYGIINIKYGEDAVFEIPKEIKHEHTFSTEWTKDESYHWHASTCPHDNEVKDKAEHTLDGGICTVCRYGEWEVAIANLNVGLFDENLNWSWEESNGQEKETEIKSNSNLFYLYKGNTEEYIEKCDDHYIMYVKYDTGIYHRFNSVEFVDEYIYEIGVYSLKNWYNRLNGLEVTYDSETDTYIGTNNSEDYTRPSEFFRCTIENGKIVKIEVSAHESFPVSNVITFKYGENAVFALPEEHQNHECQFSNEWTSNENYHWYAGICEHNESRKDVASHTFNNTTCTICGFYCEHQFSSEWMNDANYHWHVATCGHETEIADKSGHTIQDGICTVCNISEWEIIVERLNVGYFDENLNYSYEVIFDGIKRFEVKSNANLLYFYEYNLEKGAFESYVEKRDGHYINYEKDNNGVWNSNSNEIEIKYDLAMLEPFLSLENEYYRLDGLEAVYDAGTRTYIANTGYNFMRCTIENGRIINIELGEGETVYEIINIKYGEDVSIELPEELKNLA